MKKTYINPTLDVVTLKINNCLLAGSPDGSVNGLDPNETPKDPSLIDGRGFDDLDDDF